MKKLSHMNENVFDDILDRSKSDKKRSEDIHRFDEPFKKIKNAGTIEMGTNNHKVLWTPFNFGSDSPDKKGMYMTYDDVVELSHYLKDTDYSIASPMDWTSLQDAVSLNYATVSTKRIGEKYTWAYIFIDKNTGSELDILNPGYCVRGEEYKSRSNDDEFIWYVFDDQVGIEIISIEKGHFYAANNGIIVRNIGILNDLQVRLVKKHK